MASVNLQNSVMYSQLQPWSTVGAYPCLDQVSGHPVPERVGISYKTTKPHPWRPELGYELVNPKPLHHKLVTEQFFNPCFTSDSMITEPLIFPNLVTGFERNPQHAARAALYTRYTDEEWSTNLKSKFYASNANRNYSERLRNDVLRLLYEADERCSHDQTESGRYIGERITEITFWRDELNDTLQKLIKETSTIGNLKHDVMKAMENIELLLNIAEECVYHREGRQGIEKVHDIVEKVLLLEIDNLRNNRNKLNGLCDLVNKQMHDYRAAQHAIEEDISQKNAAIGIDKNSHQLNNFSRGINFYAGIELYEPAIHSGKTWSEATEQRIRNAMSIFENSKKLRIKIDKIINEVSISLWDYWSNTNNAFNKRCDELLEAKNRIQLDLLKIQKEIFNIEKLIDLIMKSIQDKTQPLKVTHTRLEARSHREGLELCKDNAHLHLVKEVHSIRDIVKNLHHKLEEAEAQHQRLLRIKSDLETDLKQKVNSLFIDREKCMSLRRSFPIDDLIKY